MQSLIRIGVLVHRNTEYTLNTWEKTADYLTSEIPGYRFIIVPLDFTQIEVAIEQNAVEFIIASRVYM